MNKIGFALFFIAHLLIGLLVKEFAGLDITANPAGLETWDTYWQTLAAADLQNNLFQSIWFMHGQPPLHNLYGAIFINLFPNGPLQAMHFANILLGALICGMSFRILQTMTRSLWIAILGGLVITLNPALFLFEAYPLYTVPTLFFIMLCVYFVAQYHVRRQPADLFGFILAANLLVLTRSLYHPLFLLPCIALAVFLARDQRRRVLRIALLISLLGFGWATKNYLQYGFWGTSSWGGLNLWRIVSDGYPRDRLEDFALARVIDPMVVEKGPFTYPGSYLSDGFDAVSEIDSLARNDYNNINMPAIARVYQQSAVSLIGYDPEHYLTRVARAYNIYSCPATGFKHNTLNSPRIGGLVEFYDQSLYGASFWQATDISLLEQDGGCSVLYFGLPLSILLFVVLGLVSAGFSWNLWQRFLRQESILLLIVFCIVYNTVVGVFFEISENERFKFLIEPLWWMLILSLAQRVVLLILRRRPEIEVVPQIEAVQPVPVPTPPQLELQSVPVQKVAVEPESVVPVPPEKGRANGLVLISGLIGLLAVTGVGLVLLRQRKTAGQ